MLNMQNTDFTACYEVVYVAKQGILEKGSIRFSFIDNFCRIHVKSSKKRVS